MSEKKEVSKAKIKLINELDRKKNRDKEGLFVAEGVKIVDDLLPYLNCKLLILSPNITLKNIDRVAKYDIYNVDQDSIKLISKQKTPQGVLALFEKPNIHWNYNDLNSNLTLFLDDIQDPGNLGTIVRIADWFGIKNIFCSLHTVDIYNHKTIQATMGAIATVNVHYVESIDFFKNIPKNIPIYGTYMNGKNIYKSDLPHSAVVVMGNEGNGISSDIEKYITERVTIPSFNEEIASESLNVGVATAVIVALFRRLL